MRAVAACTLARRAVARAIARAISGSITWTVTRPPRTGAGATGAFLFAHALQHFSAGRFCRRLHHIAAGWFTRAAPNGLAAHGDGLGTLIGLRFKTGYDLHFQVLLGKALDVLHKAFFVHADQVDGRAIGAGAAGAADAVHIVFADVGDFIVHHMRQLINVDAARSNVGGNQRTHITALETGQRLGARCLAFVAVQGHGADAVLFQIFGHVVGAEFGAGKDQHLAPVLAVNDVRQQGFFLAAPHRVNDLVDALHRSVARCHLHALRVFE